MTEKSKTTIRCLLGQIKSRSLQRDSDTSMPLEFMLAGFIEELLDDRFDIDDDVTETLATKKFSTVSMYLDMKMFPKHLNPHDLILGPS